MSNSPPEEDPDELNLKEILLDVKTSLKAVTGKLDLLTARLDQIKQRVDTNKTMLDNLETWISDIDDQQTASKEQLLKKDRILDIIKAKHKDLEARSRHSNLRIAVVTGSTAISKIEDYAENLLHCLFVEHLSPVFIVECAHFSLGPALLLERPPG
ncbi:hypothetical protein NDU88_003295 [Pleurodeles waltl]|uniref:Uncharacterized protein n=1 Tax=Pleurodeles waltl TaxID=8319 RepID=A0AAV7VEZ9_PLEWA|nr:hypothetical protein NDU88_003295 [Pleurodeles waltl]